jgi:hypothetical protein
MMAINNAIRALSFGVSIALSASAFSAQKTATPTGGVDRSSDSPPSKTLALSLPKVPRITCTDDQLTISADNSTLKSVLAGVQSCTGIQIDIPDGAAETRTFESLGPAPTREVLASLLGGTGLNFVIGSSGTNPEKVETVMVMLCSDDKQAAPGADDRLLTPQRRAWLLSRQNRAASLPAEDAQAATEDTPVTSPTPAPEDTLTPPSVDNAASGASQTPPAPAPTASAPSTTGGPISPESPVASASTTPISPTSSNSSSDSDKSTAERISDMQQLFQQRRMMTQSQTPAVQPQ